jgi:RNA polymerase sigma-70 factor (ECF subfamily)
MAPELRRELELEEDQMPPDREIIEDDTLRLIFTCCHPILPADAQIALTLREICGLTTEEIAAAYLSKPATIAQRIVRAKSRIHDAAVPYEVPPPAEWDDRLETVLHTIYLIFNEGYEASSGDALIRHELCAEAVRLARLLKELHPGPDIDGLLALMLLHQSRAATRTAPDGSLVLLEQQDRTRWDQALIAEGTALAELAFARPPVGSYTIQAMIAATHAAARTAAATDWARIAGFYDLLLRAEPTAVVALNRAVAIAMRDGPEAGLQLIDPLAAGELVNYRFAHAARADLLRRLGRADEARAAYHHALELTQQASERKFLERRLGELR